MTKQLEFIWDSSSESKVSPTAVSTRKTLEMALSDATALPIQLTITNNTSTLMSFKRHTPPKVTQLRLHHMFLSAPPAVQHALAQWVLRPKNRRYGAVLDRFIREQRHQIRPRTERLRPRHTQGEHFDLQAIFKQLNAQHFQSTLSCAITWGKHSGNKRRRSIRFGSYAEYENLIRIHPLLDQDFVPAYFLHYIVFHEMLHAHLGVHERTPQGKRRVHSAQFKALEKTFPDYERALTWMNRPATLRRLGLQ